MKGEINEVPRPPARVRPSRTLWLFGNGDMGQFGLGTGGLGEVSRPEIHGWFEQARQTQALGLNEGAGIERLAVGGMHNLVIDEVGKVGLQPMDNSTTLISGADLDLGDQRQLRIR